MGKKRGSGTKKGRQGAHNRATQKYIKQRVRTEANKKAETARFLKMVQDSRRRKSSSTAEDEQAA